METTGAAETLTGTLGLLIGVIGVVFAIVLLGRYMQRLLSQQQRLVDMADRQLRALEDIARAIERRTPGATGPGPSDEDVSAILVASMSDAFDRSLGALRDVGAIDDRELQREYSGIGTRYYDLVSEELKLAAADVAPQLRRLLTNPGSTEQGRIGTATTAGHLDDDASGASPPDTP